MSATLSLVRSWPLRPSRDRRIATRCCLSHSSKRDRLRHRNSHAGTDGGEDQDRLRRSDNQVAFNARYAGRALGCEDERVALKGRIDCTPEMYHVVGDDDIDAVER